MTAKEFEAFRKACLANARSFLSACKKLDNRGSKHIRYHLATLALEEVGKIEMVAIQRMASTRHPTSEELNLGVEDHERKLFWAFWGASFARTPITQRQIDEQRDLAKIIHAKRLGSLYTNILKPIHPGSNITVAELDNIVHLAEARYGMAKYAGTTRDHDDLSDEEKKVINWFMSASNDATERKHLFSNSSNAKLAELGDSKKWAKWLYKESEKRKNAGIFILQEELKRQRPDAKDMNKPKWNVRIKVQSHSHSVRPKPLNGWNKTSDWIKLTSTKDNHELLIDFILSRSIPVTAAWEASWNMSRLFVAAMNIATSGFIWWNIPRDVAKFYEQIDDLERPGYAIAPQVSPILDVNWKDQHRVLDDNALGTVARDYAYIMDVVCFDKPKMMALSRYTNALAMLAKNDIHLRFETNIWQEFWFGLKDAVIAYGEAQKPNEVLGSLRKLFPENLHELLDEFEALENKIAQEPSKPLKDITLEEVYKAKVVFDLYIGLKAKSWAKERMTKK
ncbi:MAG: hypothetical protein PWQ10_668 [Patescibacteria group bacterium]|nr:hypothetical protein [Patescibacteria group bacterium]